MASGIMNVADAAEYRGEQDTSALTRRAGDEEGEGEGDAEGGRSGISNPPCMADAKGKCRGRGGCKGEMPNAGGGRLVAEFGVLLGEDETAESGVAFRFLRRKCRFVSGQLLGSECLDSRDDGRELLMGCDLLR